MFTILALSWFTLCSGTAVAILLCRALQIPFFSKGEQEELRIIQPLLTTTVNAHILAPLLHVTGLWSRLWSPFPADSLAFMPQVALSMRYLILIETLYYFTHRLLHSVPVLYRHVHALHHMRGVDQELAPFDTFFINAADLFLTIQSLWLPLFLLPDVRWPHFLVAYHVYVIGSYLQHRPGTEHALHHKYRKVNYSFLCPFLDDVMGTRMR